MIKRRVSSVSMPITCHDRDVCACYCQLTRSAPRPGLGFFWVANPEWVIFSSDFPSKRNLFPSGFYSRFRTLLASFVVARHPSTNGT
jgi:hypothetical protein